VPEKERSADQSKREEGRPLSKVGILSSKGKNSKRRGTEISQLRAGERGEERKGNVGERSLSINSCPEKRDRDRKSFGSLVVPRGATRCAPAFRMAALGLYSRGRGAGRESLERKGGTGQPGLSASFTPGNDLRREGPEEKFMASSENRWTQNRREPTSEIFVKRGQGGRGI